MVVLFGSLIQQPLPANPDPELLALWRAYAPTAQTASGRGGAGAEDEAAALADTAVSHSGVAPSAELLAHLLEGTRDGEGDFEDWTEMASRLRAMLESGARELWLSWGLSRDKAAEMFIRYLPAVGRGAVGAVADGRAHWCPTGETLSLDEAAAVVAAGTLDGREVVHYGPLHTQSPLLGGGATNRAADTYFEHPVFLEMAGRPSVMTGIEEDCSEQPASLPSTHVSLQGLMSNWASQGIEQVFIKGRKPKSGVWRAKTDLDPDQNSRNLYDAMDWDAARFEGIPGFFITQPCVEMKFEYRVFVVHGKPVTGSGCIESLTPLDRLAEHSEHSAFAPFVEETRGDGVTLVEPGLAASAVAFAADVAAAIGTDFGAAYVVDVALIDGAWRVIEFNEINNSGLYASDPRAVTCALVRR